MYCVVCFISFWRLPQCDSTPGLLAIAASSSFPNVLEADKKARKGRREMSLRPSVCFSRRCRSL